MSLELNEAIQKLKGINPMGEFKKSLSLAGESENKKVKEISKQLAHYLKNKDYEGAKKYLGHVKKNL